MSAALGDFYNFNNKYRGLAVIIVNKNFPGHNKRRGSHRDLKMMKQFFTALDFKVKCYKDLSAREVEETVRAAARSPLNKESDCFACVISTHGEELLEISKRGDKQIWRQWLYGSDDGKFTAGDILNIFTEERCPDLAGKPKLFFIQACKLRFPETNNWYDYGVKVKVVAKETKCNREEKKADEMDNHTGTEEEDSNGTIKYPSNGDTSTLNDQVQIDYDNIYADFDDGMPQTKVWNEEEDTDEDEEEEEEGKMEEEDPKHSGDVNPPPQPLRSIEVFEVSCPNDCLIMTPVGSQKAAFRSICKGSWMFYYLHHHMKQLLRKKSMSLLPFLTLVNGYIAREYKYDPDLIPPKLSPEAIDNLPFKMMGCITHRLTGDLYFKPKCSQSFMDGLIQKIQDFVF